MDDLSRACLAQTSDAIPRVILLGRLCLYGPGAARLHEELIPVTARWTDPKVRKGLLSPYAREAELKTMDLLEEAILFKVTRPVTDTVLQQLQACAPGDVQELLPHLQARGEQYAADAEKKLRDRGQAEAKAMREILETQKKHISQTVAKHQETDERQLKFAFAGHEDELRQLEANKRYWVKRLASLERELQTEPDRASGVARLRAACRAGGVDPRARPGPSLRQSEHLARSPAVPGLPAGRRHDPAGDHRSVPLHPGGPGLGAG
jgi:hypothetical protein